MPIILVIVVVALVIAAIVSLAQMLFSNGQGNTEEVNASRQSLLATTSDRSVQMTVRGPIVADEEFRSYRVTASNGERTFTTYSGYLSNVISAKTYSNNTQAYEQFVHALDKANTMAGAPLEGEKDDTRGICATGSVYEFEVLDGSKVVERRWTSTCGGSGGSFRANTKQVSELFLGQVPKNDAKDSLSKIKLR